MINKRKPKPLYPQAKPVPIEHTQDVRVMGSWQPSLTHSQAWSQLMAADLLGQLTHVPPNVTRMLQNHNLRPTHMPTAPQDYSDAIFHAINLSRMADSTTKPRTDSLLGPFLAALQRARNIPGS